MRYRLRTLVLLTAIGPPVLAASWWAWQWWLPWLDPKSAAFIVLFAALQGWAAIRGLGEIKLRRYRGRTATPAARYGRGRRYPYDFTNPHV